MTKLSQKNKINFKKYLPAVSVILYWAVFIAWPLRNPSLVASNGGLVLLGFLFILPFILYILHILIKEKDKTNSKKYLLVVSVILYWLVFVVVPFIVVLIIKDKKLSFDLAGYIFFYILFLAPFLFIIPYKLSAVKLNRVSKLYFVLFSLIIPYIIIYIYMYT